MTWYVVTYDSDFSFLLEKGNFDYHWTMMIIPNSVIAIFAMVLSSWNFMVGALEQLGKPTHIMQNYSPSGWQTFSWKYAP